MKRTIMISDIHGCIDQLDQILQLTEYNSTKDKLILLGDYVDRGPNSKEVVDKVIQLVMNHNAIALRGNHDQRLVDLINSDSVTVRSKFLEHGGKQTLQSYDINNEEISDEILNQAIEFIKTHYYHHNDYISKLPFYHEDKDHIYVHAGLNPNFIDWKNQPEHDFMYIKDEFIRARFDLNKKIIFGHTKTIDIHGTSDIWFSDDKIGIDGGCAYGMQLNCLIFQEESYITEQIKVLN
ncbi:MULTISPECIES: metallophosphoesterase family protein [Paenibacillus]|uniref:Serine/threonine protein phosphatase 1 n=1 Tax=Paenibacillus pabuli TaxID=1472 RepID=A0A855Y211_9BACL|nr:MULTISPECIES: metallophosphoesterase family protein [Paenibacillus]PWW45465.1 serine/threonine protein phosphatase 1 [Paenibacillus pabuli]PXW11802.1 serine/threonine protein phosphatase 1 [Paenibacillus taichungensis]